MRVTRTLLVGDEPRDIVFAGANRSKAFITTAHRGQNTGRDPELSTPGVGRADVWVFDARNQGTSLGGDPLTVLTLFTDTPRALAASPEGNIVYAAGFLTGNRTTVINEYLIREATQPFNPSSNRSYPGPLTNYFNIEQPGVGLIVKYDGSHWIDELFQQWDDLVMFNLPDQDVFAIDARANPPKLLEDGIYSGVGTVLFNMIVNPFNGRVYVSNTEAHNEKRFEGTGLFTGGRTVRGHLHESHITVLNGPIRVKPIHLNKHIDYSQCCASIPNDENSRSVAFPQDMQITKDGQKLFVAAFGTGEVAVYNTKDLENNSFIPNQKNQIPVSGGGPSGLALDEKRGRLYVLTRFDNSISIIDTQSQRELAHIPMFNPEPAHIVNGRRFLYDASISSSHGDSACASCHVFGDFDGLAWDLGNPDGDETENTGPFRIVSKKPKFSPMKGPMTSQSLRGLDNHGAMHWRGDRMGGNRAFIDEDAGVTIQPNGGSFNERLAFRKFNGAFVDLLGRHEQLQNNDMQAFADFILDITYPPNPIRNLDNSLTVQQQQGAAFFSNRSKSDGFSDCNGCHVLDHNGNREFAVEKSGFFGTDGQFSPAGESQTFKIPHLRNLYQKVGMFGMKSLLPEGNPDKIENSGKFLLFAPLANKGPMGPQVRGFGFLHDGSVDTLFRFLSGSVFFPREPDFTGLPLTSEGIELRRSLESFLFAFDSNLSPIVGQQVTLNKKLQRNAGPRIDLLIERADQGDCELIAKRRHRGYLYIGSGLFKSDQARMPVITDTALRKKSKSPLGEITYTCVPLNSGVRNGIDRDEDGLLDGDEGRTH